MSLTGLQGLSLHLGLASAGPDPVEAAHKREIIRAIHTVNAASDTNSDSELRFAVEPNTGQVLIRLVDRVTNEVIEQVPPDSLLRTAEALRALRDFDDD